MRKVICDKCGGECAGFHATLSLHAVHETGQGEEVGQDDYQHVDLCRPCCDEARAQFGFRVMDHFALSRCEDGPGRLPMEEELAGRAHP